jgi:hypothetical protein
MAYTAPAATFVLYHTKIGIGAMNIFGINFQWRGKLYFFIRIVFFYHRKWGNECLAPIELALRISRLCGDFFYRRWQLLSQLPIKK